MKFETGKSYECLVAVESDYLSNGRLTFGSQLGATCDHTLEFEQKLYAKGAGETGEFQTMTIEGDLELVGKAPHYTLLAFQRPESPFYAVVLVPEPQRLKTFIVGNPDLGGTADEKAAVVRAESREAAVEAFISKLYATDERLDDAEEREEEQERLKYITSECYVMDIAKFDFSESNVLQIADEDGISGLPPFEDEDDES